MKNTKQKDFYDERLHEMLRYKRPHEGKTEHIWVDRFLGKYETEYIDEAAFLIEVPLADGTQSKTIFSCHVDTVHRTDGMQRVKYDRKTQCYFKDDGEPLGADDGAGAWIMLEMIDAGIPGMYIFHRGEERGGIGSSYMASKFGHWLEKFDRAIAFDRRGSSDVITHQGSQRCCSDDFAQALSDAFNAHNDELMYVPDDGGVFTDTANYTELIPECTNVSCGYQNEHTGKETLHLPTVFALRDACLSVDWENLPTKRDPKVVEYLDYGYGNKLTGWGSWGSYKKYSTKSANEPLSILDMSRMHMVDLAYEDPETFVAMVREELFGEAIVRTDDNSDDHAWTDDEFYYKNHM